MTYKRNNNKNKYGYEQQQLQIQETAHEMESVLSTFYNCLEALEEYIGKLNHYSNWHSKRQIYRRSIADSNDTLEGFEDLFLTQLLTVKASINRKPEFFRKEVQKEFYKWINTTGIDANNCPERLKNYLFTINEVLEGRGENFVNQTRELVKNVKLTPQDALKIFSEIQEPLSKSDKRKKELEGKNWNEVENDVKLGGGDFEQGEKAVGQISRITSGHENFNFYQSSYYQQSSNLPAESSNVQIIQDVIQNPQNWRIDEVITRYSNFGKNKEEMALIHRTNARLDDHNYWTGELNLNNNPIYKKEKFSNEEWVQIESVLLNTTSNNQTIRWDLVNKIKQRINEFEVESILVPNGKGGFEEESWIIHNSTERKSDKNGSLVFDPNKMFKVKELTEAEQKELGIQQQSTSAETYQVETKKDNNRKGGNKGGFGGHGSSIIFGSITIISLIGLAFTK